MSGGSDDRIMNLKRLQYFVKIVDIGNLTQAADILHVAQPALSQQLATLESEVRQQLLVRTPRGVTPTEAGKVLYRHAQLILRQCDQARVDMRAAGEGISGAVSVGLAPGTAAAGLAMPLLSCHEKPSSGGRALPQRDLWDHALGTRHERQNGSRRAVRRGTIRAWAHVPTSPARKPLLGGPEQHPGSVGSRAPRADRRNGSFPASTVQRGPQSRGRGVRRYRSCPSRRRRDRVGEHAGFRDRGRNGRDDPARIDGEAGRGASTSAWHARIIDPCH